MNAHLVTIEGFSAHADRNELLVWLKELKTPPRKVFVVHGDEESAKAFGELVESKTGWKTHVPVYKEKVTLD